MSKEYDYDYNQNNLEEDQPMERESSSEPWKAQYGEDENLKNRKFSRTARKKPIREATTMSKVLLFILVLVVVIPFILFFVVNGMKGSQKETPKTAEQVMITKSSESQSASSNESTASGNESNSSQSSFRVESTRNESAARNSESSSSMNPATSSSAPETIQPTTPEPTQPTQPTGQTSYVVQGGDSWWTIAQAYGVDVYALAQANGGTIDSPLFPGDTIIIP